MDTLRADALASRRALAAIVPDSAHGTSVAETNAARAEFAAAGAEWVRGRTDENLVEGLASGPPFLCGPAPPSPPAAAGHDDHGQQLTCNAENALGTAAEAALAAGAALASAAAAAEVAEERAAAAAAAVPAADPAAAGVPEDAAAAEAAADARAAALDGELAALRATRDAKLRALGPLEHERAALGARADMAAAASAAGGRAGPGDAAALAAHEAARRAAEREAAESGAVRGALEALGGVAVESTDYEVLPGGAETRRLRAVLALSPSGARLAATVAQGRLAGLELLGGDASAVGVAHVAAAAAALPAGEDLAFAVAEVAARLRQAAAREAEVAALRATYLLQTSAPSATAGSGAVELLVTFPHGVVARLRLGPHYPALRDALSVVSLVGVGGWRESELEALAAQVADGGHCARGLTPLLGAIAARLAALEAEHAREGGAR